MAVSISAVVLLAAVVALLLRKGTVGVWSALACTGFGFFLASTAVAPVIRDAIGVITGLVAAV
ncbi:hypothetical protein [Streptomyces sp. NPDC093094]|uniref:hypothetical protein n=1 Tax=Streptomyces sp. NPDC093094 TaxID=3366026 RepID=UPI0037F3B3A2